jgi:rod shape-determining protein MreD
MNRYTKYGIVSIVLIIVQTTLIQLLNLEGIMPDILAIWVVYIAIMEGQMEGMLWGFAVGLVFDFTTQEFIGLSALTKMLCGFLAGYFYNENKTRIVLSSYRFLLIVAFASFFQNVLYFIVFTRGSDVSLFRSIFVYGLTTTFYTSLFTIFPIFILSRKPQI